MELKEFTYSCILVRAYGVDCQTNDFVAAVAMILTLQFMEDDIMYIKSILKLKLYKSVRVW